MSTTVMPPTGIHLDAPASLPGTFDSSVPEVFDSWPVLPSSTRSTSPPLDFLVDEDPFANLATPTRSVTEPSYPDIPPHREIPRSPLADTHDEYLTIKRSTSLPRLAHGQPASERPAFPRKMSHISLRTLAQENTPVVMLKVSRPHQIYKRALSLRSFQKVRKRGTVGATLPLEPWTDQDKPDEVQMQIASKSGTGESSSSTRSDLNDAVSQATLQTTDGVPSTSILALDTPFAISVTTSPESSFSELPSLTGDNSSEGESSAEDFYDCEEAPPSSWTLPDTNFFTENWVHTLKSPVIVKSSRSSTDGVVDGGEGDERHHRSRQHAPDQSRGSEHSHGYTGNAKPFSRPLGQRNGSDGGDGGDDEDERRREKKDSSSCATAEPIPDSEEEETKENDGSSSDDDVPLAQRIPGALKAQKSIRQRVRADKEEKKKQKEKLKSDVEKYRQNTSNGTSGPHGTVFPSSKEGESSKSSERWKRVRAETMSAASGSRSRPILADDLLRKLKEVQVQASDPHTLSRGRSRREPPVLASSAQLPPMPTSPTHQSHAPRGLRPMRSLHHIRDKANGADDHQPLSPKNAAFPTSPQKSSFPLSRGRSQGPGGDAGLSRRATSTSRVRGKSRVRDTSPIPDLPPMRVSETINRNRSIKVDKERSPRPSMNSSHPSPPPVPADTRLSGPPVQKRIFIGDLQSYNTVEVRPDTTAADVVQMIENQGSLKSWDGVSTWMLHEVAQDFGMGEARHCILLIP